jgi:pimeloyl-ACP methyl ester carboxylesterase
VSAPSPEPARIRFVDVDGVRLRTSVRGSGSPLLLITGLGASLDLAEPFERELVKRGHQVVSFDAPGVGESTPYLAPRRMRGVARTVAKMAAALGYDRMDVLGVSLGGVVAQQLAHQSPDLVRRLILAATGPGLGGVPGSPRVLLTLATPHRYYQPDYYRRIAARDIRRPGPHRPRRAATRLGRPLRQAAQPAWLPRPALRDHRLDQPALAAQAAAAHARPQRRRPDRSARQRSDPRPAHPRRAATRAARRRTPVPARTPGRDSRPGCRVSPRQMRIG